ncbi:sensor histidine kinase [Aurantimonas sp. C2-6-R+9]|uniref:sensor histidine kinase n=1 Tax=unclassified Aurantimonas TaxID=2638230 RepID=UPI002E178116|nr:MULTISPECIES: sensor histidine kinase [unclassified Aurantimonas]MEC5291859.1 sensor histidine kinase [Aurantimonas sp. C2-3-R2]MEC5381988.1 sensor histidine kinase [Aurantimonas sp. C2-6-R+9]MEC5412925.1 sensor histidine kinase [Aurantimonas sp. C2-4-R8]
MNRSLRSRLFLLIVLPLVVVAGFAAVARYVMAERTSQTLYDNTLLAVALAISRDVVLSEGDLLSEQLLESLTQTLGDAIYYEVTGPGGRFVTGYTNSPPQPGTEEIASGVPAFFDAEYFDAPVRAVILREFISEPQFGGWVTVKVWQTVRQRDALSLQLAMEASTLMAVVIVAAGAFVWFGINFGLRPLLQLREAVERRSQDDLSPIRRTVPREVKSLVRAMNALFRQLSDAFAARDAFISNAAHQLRNPIAAILAQAEAAEAAPPDADLRGRVSEVAEAARRTARLTQQLLSLERARGLPPGSSEGKIELAKLAADILRGRAAAALLRGIDVSLDVAGEPVLIRGDPVLLGEALENLLDNAIRYGCRDGGAVRVAVRFEPGIVRLAVEDDGPGVPADQRDRVFERFQRGVDDGVEGCGLGLAIVREIVERHGGHVWLADAPGGARFVIELPVARAAG